MSTGDPVLDLALSLRSAALDPLMTGISKLNSEYAYLAVLPLIYWVFSRRLGFYLLMADAFSTAAAVMLKNALALPRPDPAAVPWLDDPSTTYAFPSGHTTAAAATWWSLAALLKSWKVALLGAAVTAAVAFSRLYLGVHYTRDVAGGAALGLAAGIVLLLALPTLERRVGALPLAKRAALLLIFPALALADASPEALMILSAAGAAALGELVSKHLKWELETGDPRRLPLFGAARVAIGFPVLALLALGLGDPLAASAPELIVRFAGLGIFTTLVAPRIFTIVEARLPRRAKPPARAT